MIWKILLTLGVIALVYVNLRARRRAELVARGQDVGPPLVPAGTLRLVAWGLVAVMAFGSGFYLLLGWLDRREVVEVQVVNASTGGIDLYQAHRGSIAGRRFTTLDGREIRLADVERLIILPQGQAD